MYLIGIVAAAAVLALGISAFAAGSGSARRASLRVAKTTPLTVVGSHFKSRERARVTATVSGSASALSVRASRTGSFTAAFATGAARCSSVRVVAVGNEGSRAVVKRLPAPACSPD